MHQWPSSDEIMASSEGVGRCSLCWKPYDKQELELIQVDVVGDLVRVCEDCLEVEAWKD